MKVNPVSPIFYSPDRDERHEAEKRRISLLLKLLGGMDVPHFRVMGLSLNSQRYITLRWLSKNLVIKNKDNKSFSQANNLIKMLLASERRKNERV